MSRRNIAVRGIYGGAPNSVLEKGLTLAEAGFNAVWMGSSSMTSDAVTALHDQGASVFAEFNTMHHAAFLVENPDAAPVGPDGQVCPPPDGWQGGCPTHPGYRRDRMDGFRNTLENFDIDGIWLDYHHSHASWEQAEPNLPDTCFCPRCLRCFEHESATPLPSLPVSETAAYLLGPLRPIWSHWRCDVFTDWVREFRNIRDAVRPKALLGTFHCPWTDTERDGALREKLAIDLRAQRAFIDVFSPMPYHARFGHADDIAWIGRQISWLGEFLDIDETENFSDRAEGPEPKRKQIWPIVQLSDWGESVPVEDVKSILIAGTAPPATGITVFNAASLQRQPEKIAELSDFYRSPGL